MSFKSIIKNRSIITAAVMACSTLAMTSNLMAQHHGDVAVGVENNTIITGNADDKGSEFEFRVFGAEFGEEVPFFTDEPGFIAGPGTFAPDQRVGWNALNGVLVWNGGGFDAADTVSIQVSFASLSFVIDDVPVNGFDLGVLGDGSMHRHLNFLLLDDNGDPAPGIYLMEMELYATAHDVESSDPFWVVFNNEDTEENHDAAVHWVEENLAGEHHCPSDINGDEATDTDDLLSLLAAWGTCVECPSDINDDGNVDTDDLLALLAAWGPCDG